MRIRRAKHRVLKGIVAVFLLLGVGVGVGGCGRAPQGTQFDNSATSPVVFLASRSVPSELPNEQRSYTLAASIYAGWMPWYYADNAGVLAKWARQEGIEIELVSMDYVASIEAFVTGRADACLVTNIDALGLPAAAGIDSTVLLIGDYSNGNDKILARGIKSVADLRGAEVLLVELSVSDYLLSRALEAAGMTERDVRLVNTGDSKIATEYLADKRRRAVVTWNPIASGLEKAAGVRRLYDSAQIPGEILDLCVVNTETLRRDPRLGRALVGAWFEVLTIMRTPDARGRAALAKMAELAGSSVADYQEQLDSTFMFWEPAAAAEYAESTALQGHMETVREFCFAKHLFGDGAASVDDVGIEYPGGAAYPGGMVQGRSDAIRLRFDTSFLKTPQ